MSKTQGLGETVYGLLARRYALKKRDLGADTRLSKSGMTFTTEVYEIPALGQLCLLRMNAMLGLMKMETAVLAVNGKDLPLLNLDWVRALGRETQLVELYDTQLAPYPPEKLAAFEALRARDAELPEPPAAGARWYDAILYPCSYRKAGKGLTERLARAASDYLETYLGQLAEAPACEAAAKKEKTRAFAERLIAEGGPAVDQVTKLFGAETAKRLILRHMYGAEEE